MTEQLREFAERYTAAWCSQDAASGRSLGHFDADDYQRQLEGA